MTTGRELALEQEARAEQALTSLLADLKSPRSTWLYYRGHNVSCAEKHADLLVPQEQIARELQEY